MRNEDFVCDHYTESHPPPLGGSEFWDFFLDGVDVPENVKRAL